MIESSSKKFTVPNPLWNAVIDSFTKPEADYNLFYVDTEFVTIGSSRLLVKVAIYNHREEKSLSRIINHGMLLSELYQKANSNHHERARRIAFGAIRKVYGIGQHDPRAATTYTFGIRLDELETELKNIGVSAASIFVEWSLSNCDHDVLKQALRHADLPPRSS